MASRQIASGNFAANGDGAVIPIGHIAGTMFGILLNGDIGGAGLIRMEAGTKLVKEPLHLVRPGGTTLPVSVSSLGFFVVEIIAEEFFLSLINATAPDLDWEVFRQDRIVY